MDVATIKPYGEIDGLVIVVAEIVFAVKPPVNIVAPDTVPPVKLPPEDGKLRYVVAEIVFAVKPELMIKSPVIVPPLLSNLFDTSV